MSKFCSKCGQLINDDSSFCLYCGERVINERPTAYGENTEDSFGYGMPYYEPEYQESPAVIKVAPVNNPYDVPVNYNPPQQAYQNYNPVPPVQQNYIPVNNVIPPEYTPLSAWAYYGYKLLFMIPIVGFICLIVFSCSSDNINRRNFARSYWCDLVIGLIIFVVALVVTSIIGVSVFAMLEY